MKLREFLNNELMEMANVATKRTGLNQVIWISSKMGSHGPRIKVSNNNSKFDLSDNFSVSISDNPEVISGEVKIKNSDLKKIKEWIKLNRNVLMKLWEGQYDDHTDAILDLKPIKG